MASSRGSLGSNIIIFFLLLFATTGPLFFCEATIGVGRAPAVYMYGDSILDTGNNDYIVTLFKSNFPPYGKNFPGRKPTGRFSDGKLISDFIVQSLGIKETLPAYLDPDLDAEDLITGVNFAFGGCGYDPLSAKTFAVPSIQAQLNLFKQYKEKLKTLVGEQKSNDIVERSLHVISAGNDDVGLTYFLTGRQLDLPSYAAFLVTQATANLRQLYKLGARKIAVFSTTVTGCVPFSRTFFGGKRRQCSDVSNELAMMFNDKLSEAVEALNDDVRLPNLNIVFVDVYRPLLKIIRRPENYGFDIATEGCCGTGAFEFAILCNPLTPFTCANTSKYLYFDGAHPTEKAYKIVFSEIWNSIIELL
ncbi:unnamed protein product [Linum tenue]|uniref:Uncharacterized protein n=1 Tax=Linum tenue TaxID=586396 RepID=A0AAV0IPS3_9ROSI|nr:unnamed protein product [Linum tenue]